MVGIIVAIGFTKAILVLKEIVFTSHFGVGTASDIYFFSIITPLFLFGILSGGFNYFFIPNYFRIKTKHGDQTALKYIRILFKNILLLTAAIALILGWIYPHLLVLFNPSIISNEVAVESFFYLSKLAGIFFFLLALSSLLSSILQAEHRYLVSIYPQAFIPLGTIISIITGSKTWGISSIFYGAICGALMTNIILICAFKKRFGKLFALKRESIEVDHNLKEFFIVISALFFACLTPLADQYMASFLNVGDLSVLNFGTMMPLGLAEIFATGIGMAIFSYSSQWFAQNEIKQLQETTRKIIRDVTLFIVPLCILLSLFAYPIISIIFARGAFTQSAAIKVSEVFALYSFTIYFVVLAIIGTKIISSIGKNYLLLPLALIAFLLKIVLNIIFIPIFHLKGILFSALITYFINAVLIFAYLMKENIIIKEAKSHPT